MSWSDVSEADVVCFRFNTSDEAEYWKALVLVPGVSAIAATKYTIMYRRLREELDKQGGPYRSNQ